MNPIVLLGEEAPVDARFSSFGDSANLDVGYVESRFEPFGETIGVSAR
jgi:hypothetical protein